MSDTTRQFNSKFAWRDIPRCGLPKRPSSERLRDFLEIYGLFDEDVAREQASRCIQCPNPSCVNGCPLCNPIPKWMALTAEGRFLEAAAFLGSVTNMAEICARLCPQERLCEGSCLLGAVSEPVAIADIERFLMEYALVHGHAEVATPPPSGYRVAVVGAGPGGLACADELASRGDEVEVFDSNLLPGGLQWNGLPSFRLERSILQRRIDILKKRGVLFRLGVAVGKDLSLGELRQSFDAVYLGFDSREARKLGVPGADAAGVVQALPFILRNTAPLPLHGAPFDLRGKRVVVIGGGEAAIDCVRTAVRCGAAEPVCVYRRGEADMPCAPHDYQSATEEGARFIFNAAPVQVLGDAQSLVQGIRFASTRILGQGRGGDLELIPDSDFEIPCDYVVTALGFDRAQPPDWGEAARLALSDSGGVAVDENQATNLAGVYAGGDLVRGPCTVLEAVRDARIAAAAMHGAIAARKQATPASTSQGVCGPDAR